MKEELLREGREGDAGRGRAWSEGVEVGREGDK